jgi:peptidoglycan/LPS O-acetylase OafA/YrhL
MARHRINGLDSLRGIAALSVVLFHYTTRFGESFGHPEATWLNFSQGFRGVDLFFMISGFVIFMTLDNTASARDFVVSRFSRLFPTFWASMLLTYIVVTVFGLPGKGVGLVEMILNFTMVPGLLNVRPVDGTYWTLEIELIFYALMLLLFLAGALKKIHLILGVWLLARLVVLRVEASGMHVSYTLGHLLLLPHIALFGAGMMLYCLHRDAAHRAKSFVLLAACIAVIAIADGAMALPVPVLGSAVILMMSRRDLAVFRNPVILFFGTISYPLYLLHENIGFVILRGLYRWDVSPNLAIALTLLVVVALSSLVSFRVEQPAMRAVRQWYRARFSVPATS